MPTTSAPIPLAPIEVPSDPVCDRLRQQSRTIEFVLAGVVLVFAFLLASFAVRNSDFWLHLATGRLIASGGYQIGVDPFASTTEGVRWVNHSWLFDWLLYQTHQVLGDKIVILKAVLVSLLAVVMMATGRRNANLALPAAFTALALLVASPRLLLQPMLISTLFLAVTVWLLARGERRGEWLLPPLFALWVNLDAWFVLGPVTVAIFAVASEWKPGRRFGELMRVLIVGLVACLLNPHHVFAFQLPPELSPTVLNSPLLEDARFQRLFDSPWRFSRYTQTSAGLNPAGIAYFVLLALGVVSFLSSRQTWRDWRLPLWLLFTALGAFQLRLVPFFAVVAGPITALNFADALAARPAPRNMTQLEFALRRGLLARFAAVLLLLVAIVVAWPGWLQATPHELRHCEWAVRPDPTLSETATLLADLYRGGEIPPDRRLFVNHPEVGPYLAWYCPQAKTTIDGRLALFAEPKAAAEFVAICRALNPELRRERSKEETKLDSGPDGLALLRQRKIALLLLYDPEAGRSSGVFAGPVGQDPERWPRFVVRGKAVIAADRDLCASQFRLKNHGLDVESQAFAPTSPVDTGPSYPTVPTVKDQFLRRPPERSADGDAATMYLRYFEEAAQRRAMEVNPMAPAAATLPLAGATLGFGAAIDVGLHMSEFGLFIPYLDPGPPEFALLALRAARRAVAADPNDANAWLRLGQAYVSLRLRTREGAWGRDLPPLDVLRHVQIATALENAVRLEPNLLVAHQLLANLYIERQFLDLALDHRRKELELTRAAGPRPGEQRDAFMTKLESDEKRLREMEKQVNDRQNQFNVQSGNLSSKPLEQASTALKLGLARKALDDVMLKSDVRLFGVGGAQLQLHLLLMTGRAEAAREMLADPDVQEKREHMDFTALSSRFGPKYPAEYRMLAYDWFSALVGAASGDYDQAERSLRAIDQRTQVDADDEAEKVRVRLATLLAAEIGAFARPEMFIYQARIRENRESFQLLAQSLPMSKLLRADLRAVAGLLAVERGDIAAAREHFRQSLSLARGDDGQIRNYAGRAASAVMLKRIGE
jgi:hypothetical protein